MNEPIDIIIDESGNQYISHPNGDLTIGYSDGTVDDIRIESEGDQN